MRENPLLKSCVGSRITFSTGRILQKPLKVNFFTQKCETLKILKIRKNRNYEKVQTFLGLSELPLEKCRASHSVYPEMSNIACPETATLSVRPSMSNIAFLNRATTSLSTPPQPTLCPPQHPTPTPPALLN